MTIATYFYVFPFADTGDREVIPTDDPATTPDPVSYQKGFTDFYTLDLDTDPNALPVPREKSNGLYYAMTRNIKQYQIQGVPNWIAPADNNPGGTPTPYPYTQYARVYYSGQIYENQLLDPTTNTAVPTDPNSGWLLLSGNAQGVVTGTIIDFGGVVVPTGYLPCDDTTYLRADYPNLLAALTQPQTPTLTSTLATFTVSSAFGLYAGMPLESTGFATGTVISTIVGTLVTASNPATTSGATSVTFFPWGNGNGTDTFNVPDLRTYVTAGQSASGLPPVGGSVGQKGGVASRKMLATELAPHGHPGSVGVNSGSNGVGYFATLNGTVGTSRNYLVTAQSASASPYTIALTIANYPADVGSQTVMTLVQPTAITYKLIKT